jgi:hypothetical protein
MGHEVQVLARGLPTFPMPTYPEIPLAILPGARFRAVREFEPDAIHIARRGPLASRRALPGRTRVHDRLPHVLSRT